MLHLRLHHDLSCCHVDGRLVFLDIRRDRYFRLVEDLEAAFVGHMAGRPAPAAALQRLRRQGVLVEAEVASASPSVYVPPPTRSAIEAPGAAPRPSIRALAPWALLDVFQTVCVSQLQLKTRPLAGVLGRLVALRSRRAGSPGPYEQDLLDAATAFRAARPVVPVATCCLVDSIALVRFLARRGMHAHLVFGVTGEPFAAHCWAQYGDIVLNDSVGHASAHTPIRVV